MKFLVAYDGSEEAETSLALAKTYARAFRAELLIVTSREKGDVLEEIESDQKKLDYLQSACIGEGIPCQAVLLIRGMSPGEDLVRYAEEKQVDAIFIGVVRKSKVGKLLFGSNAQFVILEAPCPVMTVK